MPCLFLKKIRILFNSFWVKDSILFRFSIAISAVVVSVLISVFFILYLYIRRSTLSNYNTSSTNILNSQIKHTHNLLDAAYRLSRKMRNDPRLIILAESKVLNDNQFRDNARIILNDYYSNRFDFLPGFAPDIIQNISIFNNFKIYPLFSHFYRDNIPAMKEVWIDTLQKNQGIPFTTELIPINLLSQNSAQTILKIHSAIHTDTVSLSILTLDIDPHYFISIHESYNSYRDIETAIIDRTGVIVSHSDVQRQGVLIPAIATYIKNSSGNFYFSHKDKELYVCYKEISLTQWTAVTIINSDNLMKPLSDFIPTAISVLILAILTGFAISIIVSLHISRPIRQITQNTESIRNGSFDITSTSSSIIEIKQLNHHFLKMASEVKNQRETLEITVTQRTKQLEEAINSLWGEMQLAKKIQSTLLPDHPRMDGYTLASYSKSAEDVGGDYFDIINTKINDWIIIGDATGHGILAGLIMMMVQTAVHVILDNNENISPSTLLYAVNRTITENIEKLGVERYMSITIFSCNNNGTIYHSGMHQDLLLYRSTSSEIEVIETHGVWLGMSDTLEGMFNDTAIHMATGDTLLLYSDGLSEARTKTNGDFFGETLLSEIFKKHGEQSVDEIYTELRNELNKLVCIDDVTFVVVKKD